jgi:hypothetical protein
MDKDAAVVTTTVPDYHDGLYERKDKVEHTTAAPESSSGGVFQVSSIKFLLNNPANFQISATSMNLRLTTLDSHSKLHGRLSVSRSSLHGETVVLLLLSTDLCFLVLAVHLSLQL